ncbi:MAG: B12-binding domain-containing radical SAM protein, partial [candidate division NC10 bacterium]|nr:B12-binding domain-containing radical SAM protein [candidate division NC10 bacterium]
MKAARPGLPIVWGGWHPSMFGAECLAEPSVNLTVQAQGEATFLELVERLERGDSLE